MDGAGVQAGTVRGHLVAGGIPRLMLRREVDGQWRRQHLNLGAAEQISIH
jgi:hypothetical protein